MDKITKSLLESFINSEGLTSLEESEAFERFCNYSIITTFVTDSLNVEDLSVGSGGDTGIDGIATIVNGSIVTDTNEIDELVETNGYLDVDFIFVQAKTSSKFSGTDIQNFLYGVIDFFSDSPKLARNQFIKDASSIQTHIYSLSNKMSRKRPSVHLHYVTTGKWVEEPDLVGRFERGIEDLKALDIFDDITYHALGAREIQDAYQSTQRKVVAEFLFANKVVLDVPNVTQAYLGSISSNEFLKIISDSSGNIRKSVFYDNVRDFQDYNEVNKEIRGTLESENKASFVLMNNGVTIIAKSLQQIANKFTITDYQIVNGCQTSHVLYDSRAALDNTVQVPVKLIVADDEAIAGSIIKATNRQTVVKPQQLYALSDFQKQLEAYYEATEGPGRLYYERRTRQYAGVPNVEKVRVISIQQQLRVFASMFLNLPHKGHYARSLDAQVGTDIFVEGHRLEPYYASALAHYRMEYLFRSGTLNAEHKPLRYAILMVVRMLYGSDMPSMTSNKMGNYADRLVTDLLDDTKVVDIFKAASALAVRAVGKREISRSLTKTSVFTAEIITLLGQ